MKKGQGALEFLMTYGWAFLVILIMVGALAYFGVLNPSKFLPERCTFGAQVLCKDYLIDGAAQQVRVVLQNNVGQPIKLTDATNISNVDGFDCPTVGVFESDGTTPIAMDQLGTPAVDEGASIADGATFIVAGNGCDGGGITEGTKYKTDVKLDYFVASSDANFAHTLTGELFTNVE